jgi:hypothetical protein
VSVHAVEGILFGSVADWVGVTWLRIRLWSRLGWVGGWSEDIWAIAPTYNITGNFHVPRLVSSESFMARAVNQHSMVA